MYSLLPVQVILVKAILRMGKFLQTATNQITSRAVSP